MDSKPWYKSKTIWVNILTMLIGFLTFLIGQEIVPEQYVAVITSVVIPFVNLVLRFITKEPISIGERV